MHVIIQIFNEGKVVSALNKELYHEDVQESGSTVPCILNLNPKMKVSQIFNTTYNSTATLLDFIP